MKLTIAWSVQVMGLAMWIVMSLKDVKTGSRMCLAAWVGSVTLWVSPRFPRR